jgi:hypothetical protein
MSYYPIRMIIFIHRNIFADFLSYKSSKTTTTTVNRTLYNTSNVLTINTSDHFLSVNVNYSSDVLVTTLTNLVYNSTNVGMSFFWSTTDK